MTGARVAVYGRTYLDAEVTVPLASLTDGKGKADVDVTAILGGFAANAARALSGRLPRQSLRVVTVTSWLDWPRLRRGLPEDVELEAIVAGDPDSPWPPISVIVNPGSTCRLLRGRAESDATEWRIDRVASGALAARLHVVGRLPAPFVAELAERARATGGRIAWVGGDALPRELESRCDLMCVNTAEAKRLLGSASDSPQELATALASRAPAGAVRLVTGRGDAPAVAAVREQGGIACHARAPSAIPKAKVRRLKGAGDVFAAHFLVEACFDRRGGLRSRLDVPGALATAQKIAGAYIRRGKP